VIVVDASALIAFFLREDGWRDLAPYMTRTISVDHVVKEFYNTLWKNANLLKLLSVSDVERIVKLFKSYREKNMVLEPEEKYVDRALAIALEHSITVYDALYIAQAVQHRKPLLTLDKRQKNVAARIGVTTLP